ARKSLSLFQLVLVSMLLKLARLSSLAIPISTDRLLTVAWAHSARIKAVLKLRLCSALYNSRWADTLKHWHSPVKEALFALYLRRFTPSIGMNAQPWRCIRNRKSMAPACADGSVLSMIWLLHGPAVCIVV